MRSLPLAGWAFLEKGAGREGIAFAGKWGRAGPSSLQRGLLAFSENSGAELIGLLRLQFTNPLPFSLRCRPSRVGGTRMPTRGGDCAQWSWPR